MNCPQCGYDFEPSRGLDCPRCGATIDCTAVTCKECGGCAVSIGSLRGLLTARGGGAEDD